MTAEHEDPDGDGYPGDVDVGLVGDYDIGHRRPPQATRFRRGVSGNPGGRPKGSKGKKVSNGELPYESVLGRIMTIRVDGAPKKVTAEEAFFLHMGKAALAGDQHALRTTLDVLDSVQVHEAEVAPNRPTMIRFVAVAPGSVTTAVVALDMGKRFDDLQGEARLLLEPWIVEAALARLGARQLTEDEQRTVYAATRNPSRVAWPEWWLVRS
jgi:hypothetical protein